MPVAGKEYTRRLDLKNYAPDEAFLIVRMNPTAALMDGLDTTDLKEAKYDMYARLIKDWNFTDAKTGEVLPINAETVKSTLSTLDFVAIDRMLDFKGGLSEEKKTTTSTPPDNQ